MSLRSSLWSDAADETEEFHSRPDVDIDVWIARSGCYRERLEKMTREGIQKVPTYG